MCSLSAAYLLRQVLWTCAERCLRHRFPHAAACGYVISQSTLCARMGKAPTEREVRLGLFAHKRCVNGGKNAKKVRDLTLLSVRQIPICLTVF